MPDPVYVLAGNIDRAIDDSGQSFETFMQAIILSAGVRIGIHSEHQKALEENLKRFGEAIKGVAEHRFGTSTKVKSDFDDGNWGPFAGPTGG